MKHLFKSVPLSIILTTILVAFYCDIKTINAYLVPGADGSEGGPMAMLYLFSVVCIFVLGIFYNSSRLKSISRQSIFLLIYLALFYIITDTLIGHPYTKILFFGVFTIVSFLIPSMTQIEPQLFLKAIMVLSVPAVVKVDEIFVYLGYYDDHISMGISYAFLTPVLASIIYLFTYFLKESVGQKIITLILVAVNAVFGYYLISFGSRGPVFAIMATIFYMLVVKHDEDRNCIILKRKLFYMVLISVVLMVFFLTPILTGLQSILESQGITLHFIDKFLINDAGGDITNGRNDLADLTIKGFLNNPIIGHGLDQFYNNTGIVYPHNFILQIMYDGGILFMLVLGIPLWKGIKNIISFCTYDEFVFISALLFTSVPGALFSGNLWANGPLWMFFGALLCKSLTYKAE